MASIYQHERKYPGEHRENWNFVEKEGQLRGNFFRMHEIYSLIVLFVLYQLCEIGIIPIFG